MKTKIILLLIIFLGLVLRTYRLSDRPLGFTWDEAALGYNAYSLLNSGRDEFGRPSPVVFKSFGDYKPGLYVYSAVPPVLVFGLTEFSTRLPSAVFGTLLIPLVFLLVRRIFSDKLPAYFAAFSLAINPWAIHFSRGAWEANFALLLTLLGIVLHIRKRYFLSALFFGLTFWTYQGAKLFTPLIFIPLIFFFTPKLSPKKYLLSAAVLLFFLIPILLGLSTQGGRLKVFSVFSYTRSSDTISAVLNQDKLTAPNWLFYLFHSESLDQFRGIVTRYLNHFSPRFLFIEGDWSDLRQQAAPFYGNLHLPEFISLLAGLVIIAKSRSARPLFIVIWLLVAPVPSALSRDIVTSVRSLPLVIPLSVISGLGMAAIYKRLWSGLVFTVVLGFFLIYFLDSYFIHSPHYTAVDWLYPYRPAMNLVAANYSGYRHIVFSDSLGQPYIFALFYLRLNPKAAFTAVRQDNSQGDVGKVTAMDKFSFRPIYWPVDRGASSTLFIGDQYELPETDLSETPNLIRLGTVTYPNGAPAFKVVALP